MTNTVQEALQSRFRDGVPSEPPPVDISRVIVVLPVDEAAEIAKLPATDVIPVTATVRHADNTGAQS